MRATGRADATAALLREPAAMLSSRRPGREWRRKKTMQLKLLTLQPQSPELRRLD